MKIKPFGVEIWMNQYETQCAYNLAETCVESLTVAQLLDLAGKRGAILDELLPLKLTYGAIEGSDRLRGNIASLYARQKPENVTITHGAIGANALVYATLVEPGDRVISVLPTYQQHYSIPESLGADVQIHKLREENALSARPRRDRAPDHAQHQADRRHQPEQSDRFGDGPRDDAARRRHRRARRRLCAVRRGLSRRRPGGRRADRVDGRPL